MYIYIHAARPSDSTPIDMHIYTFEKEGRALWAQMLTVMPADDARFERSQYYHPERRRTGRTPGGTSTACAITWACRPACVAAGCVCS